jgi:Zn-dependent metalloprotease
MTKHRISCHSLFVSVSLGALAACAAGDPPADPADPSPGAAIVETPRTRAARAHLAAAVPQLSASELRVTRERTDALGMTHVRHQQTFRGIPVIGGEAVVHLAGDGAARSITDALVRDIRVDTSPAIDAGSAIERALAATVGAGGATVPPVAELRVVRRKDGDHLVWRVAIESLPPDDIDAWTKPIVLVDAHTGEIVHRSDRVLAVNANATGTARYAGNVSFRTWLDADGRYYLEDNVRKVGAYDVREGEAADPVARYADSDNVWSGATTAVQAHWALSQTWDYYHAMFSREGIDGSYGPGYVPSKSGDGSKLVSGLVHFRSHYSNAHWIDPQMVFGDGDGTTFTPLVSLDIVAHEWTHGVTSREVGLDGLDETPSLNEHISDVFGASAEAWLAGGVNANTWLMGDQVYTPGTAGDGARSMADPAQDGTSLDTWVSDFSRVEGHDGAGIGNLAFYLTVVGGSHPRHASCHVTGVGIDKAQRVWYRALTTDHLTSSANYAQLRNATLLAATDLYGAGGATYRALHSAWEAVGVPSVTVPGFPFHQAGSFSAAGQSTILPSASGFWSADGSVVGFLSHDQADDFDLELWRFNPATSAWSKVDDAVGPGNNEVISFSSGAGTTYRWRVKATAGTGAFDLGWIP